MENKKVGWLIVGIGIVMSIIVLIFNLGLRNIVDDTCTHGASCSMYDTIGIQTWISLAIVLTIITIGLYIMFSKPEEKTIHKTIVKRIKEKNKEKNIDLKNLNEKEKKALKIIQNEKGIFQKELMERLEIGKVGMTRLLDKLEAKQLIERKRRGMNNFVMLNQ
jgi:uncharacterized membrane protein